MERYFPEGRSIAASVGHDPRAVIRTIGERFINLNPPTPYTWRTYDERGIGADRQGRYLFDFDKRFPGASCGDTAVACADLYCPAPKGSRFRLACQCPTRVWLNGECVFRSDGTHERSGEPDTFAVTLRQGLNRFVLSVEKTAIGFFASLQNAMPQWEPCCYIMPFDERGGEAGWLYRLLADGSDQPPADALQGQREEGCWLPSPQAEPLKEEGFFAALAMDIAGQLRRLSGTLDELRTVTGVQPPVPVNGRCSGLLVMGPFNSLQDAEAVDTLPGRITLYHGSELVWRPALAHMALRPYVESFLFGKWTYPLGVTLYGMLESAGLLGVDAFAAYVRAHVEQVAAIQAYAEYDTRTYGFAGVNQQICWLDALDDCGSFGSLTLEFDPDGTNPDIGRLADRIARYMTEEQPCTPDGAFCRRDDTLWADDMYMSVPFLTRYALRSGDTRYMDFAAAQLLRFRGKLFLPDRKLMAHMRCLRHDRNNGIPWSRGNGWVIFSLSELLMKLPEDHAARPALLSFFRELTEGYMAVQDACGLWHQILDDPESYLESSATAMMICAFCRGLRHGWLDASMRQAVFTAAGRAWEGLTSQAIDADGNLYGVCRGSSFSFSRKYYRSLSWNFNDTHGIGIVMLAGCEWLRTASAPV